MSVRHPEFCHLVERLAAGGPIDAEDRTLLEAYATAAEGIPIEDQLDGVTRELVEEMTGRDDVWSPHRAARALLRV
jgi:hypothetical protein